MSRTDSDVACDSEASVDARGVEIVDPREVPLGGIRHMTVRRSLPNRQRTTIGAWCFMDHYGPDDTALTGGMVVPPHPHTGLQTVSWLFEGQIEHRDSTGAHALVKPGVLNLMTAGSGVQHSEVTTVQGHTLHGVQLWLVLPDAHRHQNPHFTAVSARRAHVGDATVALFIGELPAIGSVDAPTYWPIFGAEVLLPAGGSTTIDVVAGWEAGVLVDSGTLVVNGDTVSPHQLAYVPPGSEALELVADPAGPARALVLGGAPFEEEIVMWWNFIGRDHDEIVAFRDQWQNGLEFGSERFGLLNHLPALPAPELPSVRLKPRASTSR